MRGSVLIHETCPDNAGLTNLPLQVLLQYFQLDWKHQPEYDVSSDEWNDDNSLSDSTILFVWSTLMWFKYVLDTTCFFHPRHLSHVVIRVWIGSICTQNPNEVSILLAPALLLVVDGGFHTKSSWAIRKNRPNSSFQIFDAMTYRLPWIAHLSCCFRSRDTFSPMPFVRVDACLKLPAE